MSLGFIGAVPILAPTVLKKGAQEEVTIVGEVYSIALPCLHYASHLFTLVLVFLLSKTFRYSAVSPEGPAPPWVP